MTNKKYLVVGLIIVGIGGLSVGAAFYTGFGPAPGGPDESSDSVSSFLTATSTPVSEDDSGTNMIHTTTQPPFLFTIDTVEECGLTCRDVTVTLYNNQADSATNVTVFTRIFAGQNNSEATDLVWEGREVVGELLAEDFYTTTRRVELSFQEAQQVEQHDGWITIVTTVQSADQTFTFQNSEQVA